MFILHACAHTQSTFCFTSLAGVVLRGLINTFSIGPES